MTSLERLAPVRDRARSLGEIRRKLELLSRNPGKGG
jgi:hypothetical protein